MTVVVDVLLVLLKWLGIILLGVLGLLLLVIILALFAPVRYRGKLNKQEEPEEILSADGLISWLDPVVRARLRYKDKKFCYNIRVFGFCIMNSEKPKKEKQKKEKKPKKEKQKKRRVTEENPVTTEKREEPEASPKTESQALLPEENAEEITQENSSEQKEEKASFFGKVKNIVGKIKAIPGKIKEKAVRFGKTLKLLWYKKEKVVAFFEDELHVLALGKAWKEIKKLLCHILPGKIKGQVEFGTGDPESTGKALAVMGIFYGAYGKNVSIMPNFYEKRLLAELTLKGRIRMVTVLIIVLKVIRDKHVKRLKRNWDKLVKILKQKVE